METPTTRSRPLLVATLLATGFALARSLPAQAQPERAPPRSVTVTGHGEARGRPDQASIVLGVQTEAPTAQAALDENSRLVRQVLTRLGEAGVPQRDIQTAQLSVQPVYSEPRPEAEGERRLVGYRVSNQVVVTVRQLDRLGPLLDAAVRSGANQVLGLSFELSDEGPLKDRARTAAMAEARRAAEQLAALAKTRLGPVLFIRETSAEGPSPMPFRAMAMEAARAVPVEPGEATVAYDVEVTYALERAR